MTADELQKIAAENPLQPDGESIVHISDPEGRTPGATSIRDALQLINEKGWHMSSYSEIATAWGLGGRTPVWGGPQYAKA